MRSGGFLVPPQAQTLGQTHESITGLEQQVAAQRKELDMARAGLAQAAVQAEQLTEAKNELGDAKEAVASSGEKEREEKKQLTVALAKVK